MNDAHKIAARKLRSLATVIRAEAYAPHEFGVREAMDAEAAELERRADILAPNPAEPAPTSPANATLAGLLDAIDDGHLTGARLRWHGNEIWLHTTDQVTGFIREYMETHW